MRVICEYSLGLAPCVTAFHKKTGLSGWRMGSVLPILLSYSLSLFLSL